MYEGHQLDAWDHTSYLVTSIANAQRKKSHCIKNPLTFNPYRKSKPKAEGTIEISSKEDMALLKRAWLEATGSKE